MRACSREPACEPLRENLPVRTCCVEASLIDCYLSDSGLYVHESCCLGVQRHLPTYESCSRFQEGHETSVRQVWCLISVTIDLSSIDSFYQHISYVLLLFLQRC